MRPASSGLRTGVVRGIAWMIFASVFHATIVTSARRVSHLPGIEIVFFQAVGTTVCMLPWLARAGTGALRTANMATHWGRSAAAAAGMAAMYYALRHMNAADGSALLFTAVLFTVVLAALFLREPLGWRRAVAVVIGFCGAMIVIRPGLQDNAWPALAMLFVGLAFGAVNATTRFFAITQDTNAVVLTMFGLIVVLAAAPAALFWQTPAVGDIPWLVMLGLASTGAQQGMTRSFAAAPTTAVMPAYYLQLPFAALIGFFAFGEIPDIWIWPGAAIICAATYSIVRFDSIRPEHALRSIPREDRR